MHEASIVSSILDVATRTCMSAGANRVAAVNLRIGDMSDIVDEAFTFAWDALTELDVVTAAAELNVERVSPASRCLACGVEFEHDRFHRRCPECGCGDTELLRGREMEIVSIEVETDDDPYGLAGTPAERPSDVDGGSSADAVPGRSEGAACEKAAAGGEGGC